jgi:hypothetical protein
MPVTIEHPVITDRGAIRSERRPMSGRVVYIHPLGRFHLVEFDTPGGPVRETFLGV